MGQERVDLVKTNIIACSMLYFWLEEDYNAVRFIYFI